MKITPLAAFALGIVISSGASSQGFTRTSLPENHPLVATWRVELPELKCFEEYVVRSNGTRSAVSGEERNESEFAISLVPSPAGFYKWTDRISKNNGKLDCSGSSTTLGHVAVNYIRVHPSGQRFLICQEENMKSCFVEFMRKSK